MDTGNSTRATLVLLGGGLFIGLAVGAVVFFGLPSLQPSAGTDRSTSSTPAPITGAPAPDFTIQNTSGKPVTLSSFKGQPVLINFWATWCVPCRVEMPAIEAMVQKYKGDGFVALAVDADETLPEVIEFVTGINLTFEILMDPGMTVNDMYRVRAYPTTFFVDRDGVIVALQIGSLTESQLADNLNKILPK